LAIFESSTSLRVEAFVCPQTGAATRSQQTTAAIGRLRRMGMAIETSCIERILRLGGPLIRR
jgi:hypothetical protein